MALTGTRQASHYYNLLFVIFIICFHLDESAGFEPACSWPLLNTCWRANSQQRVFHERICAMQSRDCSHTGFLNPRFVICGPKAVLIIILLHPHTVSHYPLTHRNVVGFCIRRIDILSKANNHFFYILDILSSMARRPVSNLSFFGVLLL